MPRPARRISIVAYPGVQSLDVTGPYEVFSIAGEIAISSGSTVHRLYQMEILAERVGPVPSWSGLEIGAHRAYPAVRSGIDTLIVAGGRLASADERASKERLIAWLRKMQPRVRRMASVCTGAFHLARAGILDGRRATTHWAAAKQLAERFPKIDVDPNSIFVKDGAVYSSAGITAGMDLALALVEEDLGRTIALAVARQMVMFLKRAGGQSQFSTALSAQQRATGRLESLPHWIGQHLEEDLSVEILAKRVAMSPRNFARVFARTFGETPARFVELARIERARDHLEGGTQSLEEIASACGFGNGERMRKSFVRRLKIVPRDYQQRFREKTPQRKAS